MTARAMLIAGVLFFAMTAATAVRADSTKAAGEAVFKKVCTPCHSLVPGTAAEGPDLHGVVWRRAGSLRTYQYSDALKNAKFTWTPEKLDQWLTVPHEAVPESKMMFAGISDAKERAQVIKFLEQFKAP